MSLDGHIIKRNYRKVGYVWCSYVYTKELDWYDGVIYMHKRLDMYEGAGYVERVRYISII